MQSKSLLLALLALLGLSHVLPAQDARTVGILAPTHSAEFDPVSQAGFHYWDKGHLISWILPPPVLVLDRDGSEVTRAQLKLPGVAATYVLGESAALASNTN